MKSSSYISCCKYRSIAVQSTYLLLIGDKILSVFFFFFPGMDSYVVLMHVWVLEAARKTEEKIGLGRGQD